MDDYECEVISPDDPRYEEASKHLADIPGNEPIPAVGFLRMMESDLHGLKKRKKAGEKYTLPGLASDDGPGAEPQSIDELIERLEKEKAEFEEFIAWAEATHPGSSRKGNTSLLLKEYEKSQEKT